eukprot:scaffold1637_cov410-Prasinococcus_capsulatus_cf.AAC.17
MVPVTTAPTWLTVLATCDTAACADEDADLRKAEKPFMLYEQVALCKWVVRRCRRRTPEHARASTSCPP